MTSLTLCPTPLGIGTIDALVLSAFDDPQCAQRQTSKSSASLIPMRLDERVDLVLNAFGIRIIDTSLFRRRCLYCIEANILADL